MKTYNEEWMSWDFDEENYMVFDDDFNVIERIEISELDPKRYIMSHGKHAGKTLTEIRRISTRYINWLKNNSDNDLLLKQCLDNL